MAWDDVAGELLRRTRAERRLSQRELARLAGVTQSTISDIESGKRQPSLPLLGRIVGEFKRSMQRQLDCSSLQLSASCGFSAASC